MRFWPFLFRALPGRRRPTIDQVMLVTLGLPALILPVFLRPAPALLGTHTQLLMPPCFFYLITKIPCPTCGMTTSFAFLAHGRIREAFFAHPVGMLAYLFLAALTLTMLGAILARRAVTVSIRATIGQTAAVFAICWAVKLAVWFLMPR